MWFLVLLGLPVNDVFYDQSNTYRFNHKGTKMKLLSSKPKPKLIEPNLVSPKLPTPDETSLVRSPACVPSENGYDEILCTILPQVKLNKYDSDISARCEHIVYEHPVHVPKCSQPPNNNTKEVLNELPPSSLTLPTVVVTRDLHISPINLNPFDNNTSTTEKFFECPFKDLPN